MKLEKKRKPYVWLSLPAGLIVAVLVAVPLLGKAGADSLVAELQDKLLSAQKSLQEVQNKLSALVGVKKEESLSLRPLALRDEALLGGVGESASDRNVTGLYDLTLKDSDSSEDTFWHSRRIVKGTFNGPASSTFLSIRNTTGRDLQVRGLSILTPGTASGSMRVTFGTSTVTGATTSTPPTGILALNGSTSTWNNLSNSFSLATGTAVGGPGGLAGPNGFPVVKANEYILGVQDYTDTFGYNPDPDAAFSTDSIYVLELVEMATST